MNIKKRLISALLTFSLLCGGFCCHFAVYADDSSGALAAASLQPAPESESVSTPETAPTDPHPVISSAETAEPPLAVFRAAPLANELLPGGQMEFQNIYSAQMNGEIRITGNTLRIPDTRYYLPTLIMAYGMTGAGGRGTSQNNNLYMGELDLDTDPLTRNSSSADISLKAGASIEKAFLVWGGSAEAGNAFNDAGKAVGKTPQDTPLAAPEEEVRQGPVIQFKTPAMDAYTAISPDLANRISQYRKDYTACADVTDLVRAGGAGTYWAGDLPLSTGYDTYGGWSLVVVYRDSSCPLNDLNVFFGHKIIDKNTIAEIQISNLRTPPSGPVHSNIGMVLWESDQGGTGDYLEIGKTPDAPHKKIADALNGENNMACSAVTYKGQVLSDRNPTYTNTHGMDAKVLELTGYLENEQSTLHIRAGSQGDIYYPTLFTTEIELYKPHVEVTKTARNLTAPDADHAMDGDVIEYTITLKNSGYDTSTLTSASDLLPPNLAYIADSVEVLLNGSWISRTDAAGDDEVQYNPTERKLLFHAGSGGTAQTGGFLVYEEQALYRFRTVVTGAEGLDTITNAVLVEYAGSDGNLDKGGYSEDNSILRYEPMHPEFTFTKTADKTLLIPGDEITYTFTIQNTGNTVLTNLTLKDPMPGLSHFILDKTQLAPGETARATATYTVTRQDAEHGKVENTATVTALPPAKDRQTPPEPITRTATIAIPLKTQPSPPPQTRHSGQPTPAPQTPPRTAPAATHQPSPTATPAAPAVSIPQTEDVFSLSLWIILSAVSLAGLFLLMHYHPTGRKRP